MEQRVDDTPAITRCWHFHYDVRNRILAIRKVVIQMDAYKLRVKIGGAEFEAEGAEDTVKAQFDEFKLLVSAQAPIAPVTASKSTNQQPATFTADQSLEVPQGFERLFNADEKNGKKAVTLRLLPQGEERDSVTLLLLLWGFKRKFGEDPSTSNRPEGGPGAVRTHGWPR